MILRGAVAAKGAAVLAAAAMAATAAWTITGDATVHADAGPGSQAWIDAPLDGSTLQHGVVEVIAHAHDSDGVADVMLSVDGNDVATETASGAPLATVSFEWDATSVMPGLHELRIVGVDTVGKRTPTATVTVRIGDDEEGDPIPASTTTTSVATSTSSTSTSSSTTTTASPSTTSPASTSTTARRAPTTSTTTTTTTQRNTTSTSTTTTTTTTTPRACAGVATPRLLAPEDGSRQGTRTPTFTWAYDHGCGPDDFVIELSMERDFAEVFAQDVVSGGERSHQFTDRLDCGLWYWRVQARNRGSLSAWSQTFEVEVSARVC